MIFYSHNIYTKKKKKKKKKKQLSFTLKPLLHVQL